MHPVTQTYIYTGWIWAVLGYVLVKKLAPERRWLGFWLGATLGFVGVVIANVVVKRKLETQHARCTQCGGPGSVGARFCEGCGAEFAAAPVVTSVSAPASESSVQTTSTSVDYHHLIQPPATKAPVRPALVVLLVIAIVAVGVVGIIAALGHDTGASAAATQTVATFPAIPVTEPVTAPPTTTAWYPEDFFLSPTDPDIAFKFMPASDYQCNAGWPCWNIQVVPRLGCPGALSVNVPELDANNNVVGSAVDYLFAAVSPGQSAVLKPSDISGLSSETSSGGTPTYKASGDPKFSCS